MAEQNARRNERRIYGTRPEIAADSRDGRTEVVFRRDRLLVRLVDILFIVSC